MKRRQFIQRSAALAAASALPTSILAAGMPEPTAAKLPRWRGFNLLEKFTLRQNAPYQERDFQWMKDWGFDFVRLPMDYRCWTNQEKPDEYDEGVLKHIDQAVEFGKQYGVHINLNLHRGPGYCVNPPKEPLNLWKDDEALRQFTRQWKSFAERYKGISSAQVSFDLLNEPPGDLDEATYARVMTATVEAIRSADPERLVVVDGLSWGQKPVMSLADLGIGQSTRGYNPFQISHYKASWINGSDKWDVPTWPLKTQSGEQDKQWLYDRFIAPWKALEEKGCGVHVGEWGAYNRTPHDVVLAWMKDCTALWKDAGWGWSLWNLRGAFGVADSGREDVAYEDFDGHKLDRKMLELLKAS